MGYGKRSLGRRPRWGRGSRNRVARWLLALALAGGAAALVIGQGRDAAETMAGLGPHQAVVVARRDLDPGHAIEAGDVTVASCPEEADRRPGRVRDDVVGRMVTARIVAGRGGQPGPARARRGLGPGRPDPGRAPRGVRAPARPTAPGCRSGR